MTKEYMAIHSAIKSLAPSVKLVECTLVEKNPFATYRYSVQFADDSTRWTFHLVVTGIGKVHAALATQLVIQRYQPNLLVNVGVSGGLYEGAQIGDLCLSTTYRYHDVWCGSDCELGQVQGLPAQFNADATILASAAKQLHIPIKQGLLLCGDAFIPNAEHLKAFAQLYPDLIAVDMESGAIAQTAYIYNKSLVSIRIVSDTPLTSQDHNKQYATFWQEKANYLPPFTEALRLVCILVKRI